VTDIERVLLSKTSLDSVCSLTANEHSATDQRRECAWFPDLERDAVKVMVSVVDADYDRDAVVYNVAPA